MKYENIQQRPCPHEEKRSSLFTEDSRMYSEAEKFPHFVLASASPRRQELLRMVLSQFSIMSVDVDERAIERDIIKNTRGKEAPVAVVEALALAKAREAFRNSAKGSICIGGDTVVICDDKILGKPKDKEAAREMLETLSGKTHKVVTGVALVSEGKEEVFHEVTKVRFYEKDFVQTQSIEASVQDNSAMDKAGAYGIQGWGSFMISGIEGDYYNVMGLPVGKLARVLKKYMDENRYKKETENESRRGLFLS